MATVPTLRKAGVDELKIFYGWMREQFHPGELKYLSHIWAMCLKGVYAAYGLWDGGELIAYALLGNTEDGRYRLLDYYAVLPEYQEQGWGSRFLQMLRGELSGDAMLLEVEDPLYSPNEAEAEHCRRRIRFYERNGCRHAGIDLNLFGFDYTIMVLPMAADPEDRQVRAALEEIYHYYFEPRLYAENVHFRKEHGQ